MSKILIHITTKDQQVFEVGQHQEAEWLLRHLIYSGIKIQSITSSESWITEDLTDFLNYYSFAVQNKGVNNAS